MEAATSPSERVASRPRRLHLKDRRGAGTGSPSFRGRGRRTWRPTERTAGARMVPPGEGNEARGDGRRGVGVSHSTAEAGELSPRDPVEGRGHRQVAPMEGKTANTPRLGPISTSRQHSRMARALGMAVASPSWTSGCSEAVCRGAGCGRTRTSDLWGARVSNDPYPTTTHRLSARAGSGCCRCARLGACHRARSCTPQHMDDAAVLCTLSRASPRAVSLRDRLRAQSAQCTAVRRWIARHMARFRSRSSLISRSSFDLVKEIDYVHYRNFVPARLVCFPRLT